MPRVSRDPFRVILTGWWSRDRVRIEWEPRPLPWPPELHREAARRWRQALQRHPHLFDGLLATLEAATSLPGDFLQLRLGQARYSQLWYSNERAADWIAKKKAAYLVRVLGVSAIVETEDGQIALLHRSDQVGEYPGFLDVPGGHIDLDATRRTLPDPFQAIETEVRLELGLAAVDLTPAVLLAVAENRLNGKPELIFYLRTGLPAQELATRQPRGREAHEALYVMFVQSGAQALQEFLQACRDRLTPSAQAALHVLVTRRAGSQH